MLSERQYQELIDRMQALRSQVSERLSGSLVSNPALAEEINRQLDDLVQAARDADAAGPMPPDKGLAQLVGVGPERREDVRRRPASRRASRQYDETVTLRAHRRRRRPLLHLPAREDRRLPRRSEAPGAVPRAAPSACRRARARTRSTSSTAARCCATRGNDRLAAYRRVLGYGSGPVPGRSAAEHRLPQAVHPFHQPGDAVLARQADLATSSASGPTTPASAASPSCAGPGSTCATT